MATPIPQPQYSAAQPSASAQDALIPGLIQAGVIRNEDVERAERLAQTDRQPHGLLFYLVKIGAVTSAELQPHLAHAYGCKSADLTRAQVDGATLGVLGQEFILQHRVVPLALDENKRLLIATADPQDIELLDQVRFATGYQPVAVVADEYSLEQFIASHFTTAISLTSVIADIVGADPEPEEEDPRLSIADQALQDEVNAAPVVRLVESTLVDAVNRGASDIHFEFFEAETRIRYRIDGSLVTIGTAPKKYDRAITSRLKVLAQMNVTERRLPQDGRIRKRIGGRIIDFRVSTLPVQFGEKIVLRILDKTAVSLDISALGVESREQDLIRETIASPFGMVLTTGPTGSGKTTTLYAILSMLNQQDRNIVTVEDPVEYDFPGINQVSVKSEVGLTFATSLRSILRQDPDVVMVGEMRDQETAEIGMRAALTGHLVLSTMHTNDSVSAITRMEEMQLDRFNVAAAVKLIVAQRLVRKICKHCKTEVRPDPLQLRLARLGDEVADWTFCRGMGCDACNHTGFRGRVGLYEMLPITPAISEMILERASTTEIKQRAMRDYQMQTLRQAGLRRVREGTTTLEEVIRHTLI